MLKRLPLLATCMLATSVGCSSSDPAPSTEADAGTADGDVAALILRVDTTRYLQTSLLRAFPEGPVVLNGLNLGPLTVASIDASELEELNSDALASNGESMGDAARQVLAYAYSCALPATSSMQLEIGGETWEFTGALALAPEWESGACDTECQEWVSACILARTNQFGTEVKLSLRGDHPALASSQAIQDRLPLREGSFYGNIFTGAETIKGNAYACAGGKGSAMWELTNRFCSAIGDGCPIDTVADCNFDEFACDSGFEACTSWTACSEWDANGLPTTCFSERHKCETQAPVGQAYTRIITAYIEQPVVTAENGICEEGESGGADCADHWAVRYGSGCHEDSGGLSVDGSGNIAIVGRFIGDMDFGDGYAISSGGDSDTDLFVTSVDAQGGTNWSVRVDAEKQAMIRSVATDSKGDVIVAGHFAGEIDLGGGTVTTSGMSYFVAKYAAANGDLVWSNIHESTGFWGSSDQLSTLPDLQVAVDSSDAIVLAATFRGIADIGLGAGNPSATGAQAVVRSDVLVVNYAADGSRDWHTTIGGELEEEVSALTLDSKDNIILGGTFRGTIAIGGTEFENTTAMQSEGYVAKLSSVGDPLWGAHIATGSGTSSSSQILSLAAGANDDIVFSGSFSGTIRVAGGDLLTSVVDGETARSTRDGLVAKLTSGGTLAWVKTFGDSRDDSAMQVAWNGSDSYVVASRITAEFGTAVMLEDTPIDSGENGDIVMIRYGSDGAAQSVTQRGGPVSEAPKGLVADGSSIIMTGQFMGTLRFSGTYLTNSGGSSQHATPQDIFLTTVENLP